MFPPQPKGWSSHKTVYMKARVKATGHIVDVELSHYVGDVAWYITKCHASYSENELEFIDEPQDYWTRLEHQAAIAAMQQLVHQVNVGYEYVYEETAIIAMNFAHALVEKYKEREE